MLQPYSRAASQFHSSDSEGVGLSTAENHPYRSNATEVQQQRECLNTKEPVSTIA